VQLKRTSQSFECWQDGVNGTGTYRKTRDIDRSECSLISSISQIRARQRENALLSVNALNDSR